MKIKFDYDINKEFQNFRASFNSLNHPQQSKRQQEFFSSFSELTEENSRKFVTDYIKNNKIDVETTVEAIKDKWLSIEEKFFSKASAIFNYEFPFDEITAWLTIHDRCSYNYNRKEFFVHTHLPATNKTIMHELWHFYFHYTVGKKIEEDYGRQRSNSIKEALTVLLNVEFADLLDGIVDRGYPQHAELREKIVEIYKKEKDIYKTIDCTLKIIFNYSALEARRIYSSSCKNA